jgi:hypothetical protein
MGKKFIRPRKFSGSSFVKLLYDATCVAASPSPCPSSTTYATNNLAIKGYPINEDTTSLSTTTAPYNTHSYTAIDWATEKRIWGYSYSRMTPVQEIRLNISSTSYYHSFGLPEVCMAYESSFASSVANAAIQQKKVRWDTKNFTYTLPVNYLLGDTLSLSISGVMTSGSIATTNHLSGTILAGADFEGKYYFSIRSSTHYYLFSKPTAFSCGLPDYGYYTNSMSQENLRRYESSLRIKIIVDDISTGPPSILRSIDDVTPIVG